MGTIHIPVVLGTAREGRKSDRVANWLTGFVSDREDCTSELVDVRHHVQEAVTMPPWGTGGADEQPTKWKEIISCSQALILVVPEYNHGYPGELKLLLDSLYQEYKGMPVGIVGVSAGILGGARVIDHLQPVLREMHLHPVHGSLNIMKVGDTFSEDGTLTNEKVREYASSLLDEVVEVAHVLASLRAGQ